MWVLIAGVVLILLELATGSFYLLWYGLGLMLSGGIGWGIGSEHYVIQGLIGLSIGAILMFSFRKRIIGKISKNTRKDEFLLERGEGVIQDENLVEFRGTTWKYESKTNEIFEKGERVIVIPTTANKVFVEKLN